MLILKNATVNAMTGRPPEVTDVAIFNGKIHSVGPIAPQNGDEVVDLTGKYLMPGIVDAHSHIGMWEDGLAFEGDDGNETTDPVTPQLRGIDGLNPFDRCFTEAYQSGVTTVVTGPGSANVIGGTFAALKTVGRRVEDMIIKDPVALKIAFGENPKSFYSEQKRTPSTRMATAAILREALFRAKEYKQKKIFANNDLDKMPEFSLKNEVLVKVLDREIPLKAHAHRADDILTALRIADEFCVDITLDHCTEGYLIADILKEAKAKIILGPVMIDRSKPELKNLSIEAPAIMEKAGVPFALMTDHPVTIEPYLRISAAVCVGHGLSPQTALEAITIRAAEITGISHRVGSLEPGKDGDVAVFDADPLDARTKCVLVTVNGVVAYDGR